MKRKMYKLIATLIITLTNFLISSSIFAQSPEKMSYQAVIRNASNQLVINQAIGMQISILQGSVSGTPVYIETQTPTTNANGLVSIEIGDGTVISGDFSTIDWTDGPYFIKSETDPSGGSNFTITGISQLLSVPYALHAKSAESITGTINYTETDPIFTNSQANNITASDITNLSNLSGINTGDQDISGIATNQQAIIDSAAQIRADIPDVSGFLTSETDPIFTNSQANNITASDITNLSNLSGINTGDQDISGIATNQQAIIDSVAQIRADIPDVSGFLSSESDPIFGSSVASGITSADTVYWNNKTYISDTDGDTKIEAEHTVDEDVLRMKVANNERMSINNTSGVELQLPTNNNTSSLKIKNSDGNVVLGVDGRGLINGDGSGLSNVKPLIAYAGGNSNVIITSYNPYDPTLVKYLEITVPGPGIILSQATGYIQWKSKNADYCRMSIISSDIAINTAAFGSAYFSYLQLSGDHNLTDSVDEYNNFSYSRVFTVSAAGTYRYNLWADKAYSTCNIEIGDANMQIIYFPTGGTGALIIDSNNQSVPENSNMEFDPTLPRKLDGTVDYELKKF